MTTDRALTGVQDKRDRPGRRPRPRNITIYNGRSRWTAPANVFDLIEPVGGWLAARQLKLLHQVLDLRALASQPPITDEP